MADMSDCKPRSSKVNKGRWYHSRNNAIAWQEHWLAYKKWKETWAELKKRRPTPKQCLAQRRNEMQRMKTQELIHTTRVKQTPKCATKSNKLISNGTRMNTKKAMDSYGSGARIQGSSTTYLYPANTNEVGHGSEIRTGVVWRWGEGWAYFGVLAKALLGEMSYWDNISPKIGKYELESLNACYWGW